MPMRDTLGVPALQCGLATIMVGLADSLGVSNGYLIYDRVMSLLTCFLIIENPISIKSNECNSNDGGKQRVGARLLPNRRTAQPLTTACLQTAARIKHQFAFRGGPAGELVAVHIYHLHADRNAHFHRPPLPAWTAGSA